MERMKTVVARLEAWRRQREEVLGFDIPQRNDEPRRAVVQPPAQRDRPRRQDPVQGRYIHNNLFLHVLTIGRVILLSTNGFKKGYFYLRYK